MKALHGPIMGTAHRVVEGGKITEPTYTRFTTKPPTNGRSFAYASTGDQLCMEEVTVFNAANYLKYTNCPLCKYPKSHPKDHYTQNCPLIKKFGLDVKYVGASDKHQKEVREKEARKQRSLKRGGGGKDGDKDDGKEKPEPSKTVTINKSKNKTNTSSNSKQNDDDNRKNSDCGRGLGSASRVCGQGTTLGLGTFGLLATEYPSTSEDESDDGSLVPVSAETADNDINNQKSNPYFSAVSKSILQKFDYIDDNGGLQMCLSIACRASTDTNPTSVINFDTVDGDADKLIPDSGATAHMLKCLLYFCGNYTRCSNSFVILGDGTHIHVCGYGTACIKIDGCIIVLENVFHVPDLESNLFSTTRHGSNGDGCSFLLAKGEMYLTFPTFTITRDIPVDGDLKLNLEPLCKLDWICSDFECNRLPSVSPNETVNFLNRVFFGQAKTRSQKQAKLNKLQSKLNKQNNDKATTQETTAASKRDPLNDDDFDCFVKEGIPD